MTAEQERLVTDNLPLVKHVIRKYCWKCLEHQEYEDLFQLGCLGLVKAALTYDPSRGTAFSTIASIAIKHQIMRTVQSRRKREELYRCSDSLSLYDNVAGDKNKGNLFRYEILPDPYDSIKAVELQMDIDRALSLASDKQREAYTLRVVHGLTLDEIAKALGISHTAVAFRLEWLGKQFKRAGICP
jgi:RNA polymerase sporulation-specific sigma factor